MNSWLMRLAAKSAALLPQRAKALLYRLGPITGAIRRSLNRAVPEGQVEVEVSSGLLKGARFALDLKEEKDLWLGTYEAELLGALKRYIGAGETVYDLGANLGYLTVGMARLVGPAGAVYAFEAHPGNVARLRSALVLNRVEDRVTVVGQAVGEASGRGEFLLHRSGGMGKLAGSSGRQISYERTVEVPVITLDEYCYEQGHAEPSWIKMDVEGGEGAVLRGARRLLREARPGLLIELHGPESAADVWAALEAAGYSLFELGGKELGGPGEVQWKAYVSAIPSEWGEGRIGGG